MQLKSIKIEGYRNIESTRIDFDEKITSIVSVNNYGKSNVLQAIEFATHFISASKEEKRAMMAWFAAIPLNKKLQNQNFAVEFTIACGKNCSEILVYGYEFEWARKDGGCRIVGEKLTFKENAPNKKPKSYIKRDPNPVYLSTETARCNRPLIVEEDELIVNALLTEKELFYKEHILLINNLKVFKASRLQIDQCFEQKLYEVKGSSVNDLLDIGNIPRILNELKGHYTDRYNLIIDRYLELFPSIKKMSVERIDVRKKHDFACSNDVPYVVNDYVCSLYIESETMNQPLDARYLSDGLKKVLLMFIFAAVADIKGLILLEIVEPENCVHPKMYKRFLECLSELSRGCNILISTHSPYMLRSVNPTTVYIGVPNDDGIAEFESIKSSKRVCLENEAKSHGMHVGDFIFAMLSQPTNEARKMLDVFLESK